MKPSPDKPEIAELAAIARCMRGDVVAMSSRAGTPHLGSALSCVDILVAAYWAMLEVDPARPDAADRDRFILSKGHAVSALYSALARRGYFPLDALDGFGRTGSALTEQPTPRCVPGLELATGSLGHGLSVGIGMAYAARLAGQAHRVVVVMSDGECNEGSVWEAAMFAAAQKFDRVVAIVDYNRWQATGRSDEVMALESLREKWAAFGWRACDVDGHDLEVLASTLNRQPDESGRPTAIIAHTVKGKGVSFMEDDNNWHYRSPNAEELARARAELGLT
jgi:transketolase